MKIELYKSLFSSTPALLKPIIRILLKGGVNYKAFTKISKKLFVDVALNSSTFNRKKSNITRTSILTGIDRNEVKKLIKEIKEPQNTDNKENDLQTASQLVITAAKILHAWYVNSDYINSNQEPVHLSITATSSPSFANLVEIFGGDISLETVLAELIKANAIEFVDKDTIKVLTRYYMPRSDASEHLYLLAESLADFSNTLYFNLAQDPKTTCKFERRACSDSVPNEIIPEFQKFLETQGHEFLVKVDNWLNEHEVPKDTKNTGTTRLGLGMYLIDRNIEFESR